MLQCDSDTGKYDLCIPQDGTHRSGRNRIKALDRNKIDYKPRTPPGEVGLLPHDTPISYICDKFPPHPSRLTSRNLTLCTDSAFSEWCSFITWRALYFTRALVIRCTATEEEPERSAPCWGKQFCHPRQGTESMKAEDQIAAQQALEAALSHMRQTVLNHLRQLDPADPYTLRFAITGLLSTNFEQKDLAELIGVSRTTIGRWGQGQNIPRSPAFRGWVVQALCEYLADSMQHEGAEHAPSRRLPKHASAYQKLR
jgi:DNA-binding transcriptional regulator YiaG